jgi:transcriptional regulator with XRE-family HTH domain
MSPFTSPLFLVVRPQQPAFVDAAPVRAHLARLADQGIGFKRVADLTGLPTDSVRVIVAGRRGSGPRSGQLPQRVRHLTAQQILAVRISDDSCAVVDAIGARRRVQALIVNGWSQTKLAERAGVSPRQFGRVLRQPTVRATTHGAIEALFDQLWNVAPPQATEHDRAAAERCRGYARALGWLPPLAWDDIDTDEAPAATETVYVDEIAVDLAVAGERPQLNRLERMSAVLVLNRDRHMSDGAIADVLGIDKVQIQRYRRDSGIPAAVNFGQEVINS